MQKRDIGPAPLPRGGGNPKGAPNTAAHSTASQSILHIGLNISQFILHDSPFLVYNPAAINKSITRKVYA